MKKCFICGADYDDNMRPVAVWVRNRRNGKMEFVKKASYNNKIFKLCPDCLRAFVYGYLFRDQTFKLDYEFEEDGDA